jgi:hypothetical protein
MEKKVLIPNARNWQSLLVFSLQKLEAIDGWGSL